jgi:hypothetical protein
VKALSEARVEAMSLAIVDALAQSPTLSVRDRGAAVRAVSSRLSAIFGSAGELDAAVRARIASLSRRVPEGGREWDLLYQQYLDELRRRR